MSDTPFIKEPDDRHKELTDALALVMAVDVIRRRAKKNRRGRMSVVLEGFCRAMERWAARLRKGSK